MKNKNGFTLIELLAVIIILGILMIIAIPSVTRYINDSRKSAYIDTAKEIVSGTRNVVNEGNLGMYDTNTTYYIPAKYVNTENGLKSPYGEFTDKSAYVGVIYDGKGYKYYWISADDAGQGIDEVTPADKLETDDIKSDLNPEDIYDIVKATGIGDRLNIKVLNTDGSWENYNADNNVSEDGGSGNGTNSKTAAQQIREIETLVEIADAKRYVGVSPNNYVLFNGDERWRIIGVYGNNLKIMKEVPLTNKQYNNSQDGGNVWAESMLDSYLNSNEEGGYYYSLSQTAKDMIVSGTWYSGMTSYGANASTAYTDAKTISITRKVGLISVYEYLYCSESSCWIESGGEYRGGTCAGKGWMYGMFRDYGNNNEWTINPYSNPYNYAAVNVNFVNYYVGYIDHRNMTDYLNISPVVYLNSSIKITGGSGTQSDPYTLGI